MRSSTFALLLLLTTAPLPARAAETDDAAAKLKLNVDVGLATMYVFRGANIFSAGSLQDANLMLAPGASWEVFDTGLTVAYWSAYQLSGNIEENIDAGLGAEWDLIVSYQRDLLEGLTATGGVTLYIYPFADEAAAGTSVPTYLEPFVGASYGRWGLDLGLQLVYLIGLQQALASGRYLYINPSVGRSQPLGGNLALQLSLGFGVKVFTGEGEGEATRDNSFDLLLSAGLPLAIAGGFYAKPSLNLAWTNVAGQSFGQELMAWAGLNVGANL